MDRERGEVRSSPWLAKTSSIEAANGAIISIPSIKRLERKSQARDGMKVQLTYLFSASNFCIFSSAMLSSFLRASFVYRARSVLPR